jgi:hypothetical protein
MRICPIDTRHSTIGLMETPGTREQTAFQRKRRSWPSPGWVRKTLGRRRVLARLGWAGEIPGGVGG